MSENNKNNKKLNAIITWQTGKTTEWAAAELPYVRKSAGGGTGYLYFNPHTTKYERFRSIHFIPSAELKQQRIIRTRSAASKLNDNNNNRRTPKLPAHLRLHQHYAS